VGKSWRLTLALGLAFLLSLAGTFIFAYRAGRQARHLHSVNEPIRPWMSIPFIANTRHVPALVLFQAIGVPPEPRDRRSIRHLAHDLKRPVPDVLAQVQQAVDAAAHNPPR
jgi:hypothetical protein